ncbi:MAG: TonB-dependent receptor [Rubrivivax sp.]|nr:TonB-dependent receptor [Rubrivivax sp.]
MSKPEKKWWRHPLCRAVWPCLLATAWPAGAAEPEATQRLEIRGTAAVERRADLAGRQVVGRDELLRHGDTRLADALARVPGVSVDGRGSATALKLGGLGDGRTLLLVNGEPVPQGFSLDSLPLDSLERVEIVRGATVQAAQAIAGTINLVTRRTATVAARDIKLSLASQWGRPQATLTLNLGDKAGAATWGLGLVASSERQHWPATILQQRLAVDTGELTQRTRTHKVEQDHTDALAVNPRWSWAHTGGDGSQWQLSTDHSLRYGQSRGGVYDRRTPLDGPLPAQQRSDMALNYDRLFWRGRLQAQHQAADGARTEARLNFTHSRRAQDARLLGVDFVPQLVQDSAVVGTATDQSVVMHLRHQRPIGPDHRLDLGLEWEHARRGEDRVQTEQVLPGGRPPENLDERFDANVQRQAMFVQDEWTLGAGGEAQLGLRLERLHTDSAGNVFDRVQQSHRLVGPVARWSITPAGDAGTFKLGLSRGFRLPTPRDVMPRRYVPVEVSPTAPAFTGNPQLQPERAWSLDTSWQRKLAAVKGQFVASAALRRIDDVILDRLIVQPGVASAPWLLQRFNGGRAWAASLELEASGQTATPLVAAAPLRWQASLALHQSRLQHVAGPQPALPGQAPWQLKLDLTQALSATLTAQLGLRAQGRAVADQPSDRRLETRARHSVDASLSWQPQPRHLWRLSASPLVASDAVDDKAVRVIENGRPVLYRASEAWQRGVLWRLAYERPI